MKRIDILRYFCQYPIKILPIVNSRKCITAVLTKDDLVATSAYLQSLHQNAKEVMNNLLITVNNRKDYSILQKLLENFNMTERLPIIDKQGRLVDEWSRFELLCAWEGLYNNYLFSVFSQFLSAVFVVNKNNKIIYLNLEAEKFIKKQKSEKLVFRFIQKPFFHYKINLDGGEFLCFGFGISKKEKDIYLNIYFLGEEGDII